jgi:molecular chaperone GrpE
MSEPNIPPEPEDSAAVIEDLETLRARTLAVEKERAEFLDLLQRTTADFDNYQKRIQREIQQERQYCHSALARDLLGALDNLERATAAAQQAGESGPLVQGVAMVLAQVLDVLKRHGITRIDALGQPFDPNLHQAIMQRPSAEHPPNIVLDVPVNGYVIHNRVLRPASVVVSTAPPAGNA